MSALVGLIVLVILGALYFAPALIANNTKHHNAGAIFVLNLLLGWTLIGWVVAIVWAISKPAPVSR